MLRSELPCVGQSLELSHPLSLPRSRSDEPGRRLPSARHTNGGRYHALARDHRALLGAGHIEDDHRRGWSGLRGKLHRALAFLLRQPAHRPRDHPHQRRGLSHLHAHWHAGRPFVAAHTAQAPRSLSLKTRSSCHAETLISHRRRSPCRNFRRLGRSPCRANEGLRLVQHPWRYGEACRRRPRRGLKTVTDPHAWQNLANGKIYLANIRDMYLANIRDALIAADPEGKATYEANAQ